jgi:hypothetical protein
MEEKRSSLYLVTGLVIGILLGMFYSRALAPVTYVDTMPHMLDETSKDHLRGMIAMAYQADGDLGRARARIELLQDEQPSDVLSEQAQNVLADDGSLRLAQALADLSTALGDFNFLPTQTPPADAGGDASPTQESTATTIPGANNAAEVALASSQTIEPGLAVRTATAAPTLTPTPMASFTSRPTVTLLPALSQPFKLKDQEDFCIPSQAGLVQVQVDDESGDSVPGARIDVTWNGGEEFFFTGLYPQVNTGYADFIATPNTAYRLRVGDGGDVVDSLSLPDCETTDGEAYQGGVYLVFAP